MQCLIKPLVRNYQLKKAQIKVAILCTVCLQNLNDRICIIFGDMKLGILQIL